MAAYVMSCTLVFTYRASAIALQPSRPSLLYPMLQFTKTQEKYEIKNKDPRWIRFRNVESEEK
jgi:P pilus assembly chaperone PapD